MVNEMREHLGEGPMPPSPGSWKNLVTGYYEEIGEMVLKDGSTKLVKVFASSIKSGIRAFDLLSLEAEDVWDRNIVFVGNKIQLN